MGIKSGSGPTTLIFTLLDQDPAEQNQCGSMGIRIRNMNIHTVVELLKRYSTVKKANTLQNQSKNGYSITKNPDNKANLSEALLNLTRSKWTKHLPIKFLSLLIPESGRRGNRPDVVTSVAVVQNPLRAREIPLVVIQDYLILEKKNRNC
jgi:hypothetical protein